MLFDIFLHYAFTEWWRLKCFLLITHGSLPYLTLAYLDALTFLRFPPWEQCTDWYRLTHHGRQHAVVEVVVVVVALQACHLNVGDPLDLFIEANTHTHTQHIHERPMTQKFTSDQYRKALQANYIHGAVENWGFISTCARMWCPCNAQPTMRKRKLRGKKKKILKKFPRL